MSEFHDAVSTLLEAFARGLSIIKAQKKRRSKEQASTKAASEVQLSKSLKRNRKDVKTAYSRDLAQFGPGFAAGDAESRSSLSTILSRLSTGFLSIIERFTRGKCTSADYQALLDLSNTTRNETIYTFDQLSKRLSGSSLALSPAKQSPKRHDRTHSHKTKKSTSHHARAKSAPDLSLTPLGPASTSGWVRPKPGRRRASKSKSLSSIDTKRKATPPPKAILPSPQPQPPPAAPEPRLTPRPTRENRKSFMSFASDSTKLGEIPEHKWTRPPVVFEAGDVKFPVTTYYPLEPYEEPVKPRSRFMRLFKR